MPHNELTLNGPGVWISAVVLLVVLIGAIVMLVDALRRPRYHFGKMGPWGYVAFGAAYLLIAFGILFIRVTGYGAGFAGTLILILLAFTVITIIAEIMYLLGVVFPDAKDRQRRIDYEIEHDIAIDPEDDEASVDELEKTPADQRYDEGLFEDVD